MKSKKGSCDGAGNSGALRGGGSGRAGAAAEPDGARFPSRLFPPPKPRAPGADGGGCSAPRHNTRGCCEERWLPVRKHVRPPAPSPPPAKFLLPSFFPQPSPQALSAGRDRGGVRAVVPTWGARRLFVRGGAGSAGVCVCVSRTPIRARGCLVLLKVAAFSFSLSLQTGKTRKVPKFRGSWGSKAAALPPSPAVSFFKFPLCSFTNRQTLLWERCRSFRWRSSKCL